MFYAVETATVEVKRRLEVEVQNVWVTTLGLPPSSIAWAGTDYNPASLSTWIEPYLRFGESRDFIFFGDGHGANEKIGEMILSLVTPKTAGTELAFSIMQAFQAHFGRGNFNDIRTFVFDGPTSLPEPTVQRTQLTIGFMFYETH